MLTRRTSIADSGRPVLRAAAAVAVLLGACGPTGPSTEVRAAACDYVQTSSDADFAGRELSAYQAATAGDFDEFVALGSERQARFERLLGAVTTIESYEPMGETAGTTAGALEGAIAAGEAFIASPSDESLAALSNAFANVRDTEQALLADLAEEVPRPCE